MDLYYIVCSLAPLDEIGNLEKPKSAAHTHVIYIRLSARTRTTALCSIFKFYFPKTRIENPHEYCLLLWVGDYVDALAPRRSAHDQVQGKIKP